MREKKINLSVVVLSYNTRDFLRECLASLKHSPSLTAEVIVVDNASSDGSPQMVRKEFPRVKLIINKTNVGFARGNNIGLKEAKGDFILFLNSDTRLEPNALEEAIGFMRTDENMGALTAKTLLASGKIDPDCHRGFPTPWASITYFLGLERIFPQSRLFGQYHRFYLDLNQNHEIDAGAGAFMMIRREVVEKVGAWDEEYFFYGEDLDFFYRIKRAGFKVMFYARPLLTHFKGASSGLRRETEKISRNSKENRLKVARASVKAMEIFYRKFYQGVYPAWMTSLILLGIRIKGTIRVVYHYLKPS
ncbi:MAG TPA: glycosyltransferase family 2 protein [Patescibacteria group bacterium]|nr:glycosyltransferase family 2 protein [Patescibacteria group bacterium]